MGWWSRLFRRRANSASEARTDERRADVEARRRCAVESMEPRRLLAITPINLGVTYIEEDSGADIHGDTFEVKFEGGAPLTQLTRLVIDTDQNEPGYSVGDLLFDTVHDGYGADEAFPLTIVTKEGIGSVTWRVVDGGQKLEFDFVGFEAGDKLVFSIDVDEIQQFEPGQTVAKANEGIDPIASGVEFQGSRARGEFAAPNYFDTAGESTFRNVYDPLFAGTNLLRSNQNANGLSPDNWEGKRDRSTGVLVPATQQIMPASLCGAVYVDLNQNGLRDAGEAGIGGVTIRAVPVDTIADQPLRTLQTDASGQFCFQDLIPGEYRLEEVQPAGYFDGLDRPGTVDGQTRGAAVNPGDRIQSIQLAGGDQGVDYLFGEIPPGSLAGQVMLTDPDGDCYGPLARPLEQVEIRLLRDGQLVATTATNAEGRYEFTNLPPGVYSIIEVTPAGLIDGDEHVGSLGGTIAGDDTIASVELRPGQQGVKYDFCEHAPASLAGYVYHDQNEDGQFQSAETPIAGTRVDLLDATGSIVASMLTDVRGAYRFEQLPAGVYRLVEHQPDGWLDGRDTVGTVGGVAKGSVAAGGDDLREITLRWGEAGVNYLFGELLPASLTGSVHANPDSTCVDESQATPLADVLLELLDSQGQVVQTTRTNANGEYSFANLRPGQYSVRQAQPDQYFDGQSMAGTAGGTARPNLIDQVLLESGEDAVEYDFCELPPAKLGGQVFQDGPSIETPNGLPPAKLHEIRDGLRTTDDRPLAGVTVELRDGVTGRPVLGSEALPGVYTIDQPIRAVTDAAGRYEFRGLAGDRLYAVYEIQPTGLFDGLDTAGSTGGIAFNSHVTIPADVIAALTESPGTDAIVRIALRYGEFSQENNFSEIAVTKAPEPPPEPEPPKPEPPRPEPPFLPPYFPATPPPTLPYIEPQAYSPPTPQIPLLVPQVLPTPEIITGRSGGGGATWHLSVLDAGRPRGESARRVDLAKIDRLTPLLARWRSQRMREAQWLVAVGIPHGSIPTLSEFVFGARDAIPVAGDFNGDGRTDLGVYVDGEWFLDVNGNGQWDSDDLWAQLGTRQDRPVVGDWNGDGKDDIGIFGVEWSGDYRQLAREPGLPDFRNEPKPVPKNVPPQDEEATDGLRYLQLTAQGDPRADLIDHVFRYGQTNDTPIAGDWDGDGIDTIGIYRDGRWRLDQNGDGQVGEQELEFEFGRPGDTPVHGDFDGDGIDEIGVYRNGVWIIDMNHNHTLDAQDRVFEMGGAGDQPVVGDWNGDGSDEPGIFGRPQD